MTEAAQCEFCLETYGHAKLPTDCVLPHDGHPDRYIGLLCARHYHFIDRSLVQIEELYALMPDMLLPAAGGDERTGTRFGSPAPGRIDVMALSDHRGQWEWIGDPDAIPDVLGALESWVRIAEEESDRPMRPERHHQAGPRCASLRPDVSYTYTQPLRHRLACDHESCAATLPLEPATLTEVIRYLRSSRHWIAQQLWIDEYLADIEALHRYVARGAGDSKFPRPLGKCPNCGSPLYVTIGVDEITCRRCTSTWAGVHYARLRLILEQQKDQPEAPKDEAATA